MIVLYVLETCPYCNNALKLLNENNIKHKAIIVENTQEKKEYYKKQNKMNTFPQIFMKMEKNSYMKIGGYSDLVETLEHCNNINKSNVSLDSVYYLYKNLYSK
jgi:glutaredoxin 3